MINTANTGLVDICVNLANGQFKSDREQILQRAHDNQVMQIINTGTDLASSAAGIDWSDGRTLFSTAGVHPHDAQTQLEHTDWHQQLRRLAVHKHVVAIGETGLDFNRNYSNRESQFQVFHQQIELAVELRKPLFVHDRESGGEVLMSLSRFSNLPDVVVHCFTGTAAELGSYLDAGFYIGITGWVADTRRGASLRALVPDIPLERLMIETDAPFLKPHNAPTEYPERAGSRTKRRNEPALLPYVLDSVARLRSETVSEIAQATATNARRVFNLPALGT